jgi:hypothetical protein
MLCGGELIKPDGLLLSSLAMLVQRFRINRFRGLAGWVSRSHSVGRFGNVARFLD